MEVEVEVYIDGLGETRYETYYVDVRLTDTEDIIEYIEDTYDVTVAKIYGIT